MQYQLGPPPMNPLSRLLAALVGALALVGAFFFGFFILVAVVALGLVAWLVLWLRLWWIRRRLAASGMDPLSAFGSAPRETRHDDGQGNVIDGDYEVVSRDDGKD